MSDINDFLTGGPGVPSISWKNAKRGTKVSGIVQSMRETQRTKMGRPGEAPQPMFFDGPDGKPDPSAPIMQWEVTLAETGMADFAGTSAVFRQKAAEAKTSDTGVRKVFLNGGSRKEFTTQGAVTRAVAASGAKFEVGGVLTLEVVATRESTLGGADIKDFVAKYEPPTAETLAKVGSSKPELGEPEDDGASAGSFPDDPPF